MVIENYLCGWSHLEPIIVSSIAQGFNLLFLGSHGTGKSSLVKFIAAAFSDTEQLKFQKYAMDKENLTSMVGIPNPEELKKGNLSWAHHKRSIFNADVILLDELTRAPKDNQNMVLEMLEERTCFGESLKYKFAIATANDETYKAAFKLDAALLDRFWAVIPVPSTRDINMILGSEEIKEIVELNIFKRKKNIESSNKNLMEMVHKIRETYKEIWQHENTRKNVIEFCSKYFSLLLAQIREMNKSGSGGSIYISPRQIGQQFPRLLISLAAYYKVVTNSDEYLQKAAEQAIKYSIGTKLGFPLDKCLSVYESIKEILSDSDNSLNKIKISLTTGSLSGRIASMEAYGQIVKEKFDIAEKTNVIGAILEETKSLKSLDDKMKSLITLSDVLEKHNMNEHYAYNVEFELMDVMNAKYGHKFWEGLKWTVKK